MLVSDLSKYQQMRFKKNNRCPICGKEIKNEEFEMVLAKSGRQIKYNFFHLDCLVGNLD